MAAFFILGFKKWFREAVWGEGVVRSIEKLEGWVLL